MVTSAARRAGSLSAYARPVLLKQNSEYSIEYDIEYSIGYDIEYTIGGRMEQNVIETETWLVQETAQTPEAYSLPFAQRREARSITSVPFSFGAIFYRIGHQFYRIGHQSRQYLALLSPGILRTMKRAIFLLVIPVYWFIILQNVLGFFDLSIFMFIVGVSYVLSTLFFNHWGGLEWGMRG